MTENPTEKPIRVSRATDADRFLATDQTVWFREVYPAPAEQQLAGLPAEQRFAAEIDGADASTYPGVYGVFPMTVAVPRTDAGPRQVACAALSWVGVHPDHRRRGVLSAMMRHHLKQVHEEPETHISALHASEPVIYTRHGYGLASLELQVELGRGTTLTAPGLDTTAADAPPSSRPSPTRTFRPGCARRTSASPASAPWSASSPTTSRSATSRRSSCATRSPGGSSSPGVTARTWGSRCSPLAQVGEVPAGR